MARKTEQLPCKHDGLPDRRIGGIEPGFPDMVVRQAVVMAPPYGFGERSGHVGRQPHHLADFADRPAGAVVNDGRADGRPVPAIALIDVLDHLLAPFVLEIDVDVGRLAAVLGNEPGEEQLDLGRVDFGDAETIADDAVCCRAAPLAEDRLLQVARERHHVVDGQKIARVFELGDERELLDEVVSHLLRHALGIPVSGIAPLRAFPCQIFQMLLRRLARRHRLVGILILEIDRARSGRHRRSRQCARSLRESRRIAAPSPQAT